MSTKYIYTIKHMLALNVNNTNSEIFGKILNPGRASIECNIILFQLVYCTNFLFTPSKLIKEVI